MIMNLLSLNAFLERIYNGPYFTIVRYTIANANVGNGDLISSQFSTRLSELFSEEDERIHMHLSILYSRIYIVLTCIRIAPIVEINHWHYWILDKHDAIMADRFQCHPQETVKQMDGKPWGLWCLNPSRWALVTVSQKTYPYGWMGKCTKQEADRRFRKFRHSMYGYILVFITQVGS